MQKTLIYIVFSVPYVLLSHVRKINPSVASIQRQSEFDFPNMIDESELCPAASNQKFYIVLPQ